MFEGKRPEELIAQARQDPAVDAVLRIYEEAEEVFAVARSSLYRSREIVVSQTSDRTS